MIPKFTARDEIPSLTSVNDLIFYLCQKLRSCGFKRGFPRAVVEELELDMTPTHHIAYDDSDRAPTT